jgi:hypothetical protein
MPPSNYKNLDFLKLEGQIVAALAGMAGDSALMTDGDDNSVFKDVSDVSHFAEAADNTSVFKDDDQISVFKNQTNGKGVFTDDYYNKSVFLDDDGVGFPRKSSNSLNSLLAKTDDGSPYGVFKNAAGSSAINEISARVQNVNSDTTAVANVLNRFLHAVVGIYTPLSKQGSTPVGTDIDVVNAAVSAGVEAAITLIGNFVIMDITKDVKAVWNASTNAINYIGFWNITYSSVN